MADAPTTTTDANAPYTLPAFDASLPAAPTYQQPAATAIPANPYSQEVSPGVHNNAYDIYNAYTNMGRAPEAGIVEQRANQQGSFAGQSLQQQLADIAGSPEAQTLGRARNEINPSIDAQLQAIYAGIGTQSTAAKSQLAALGQNYNTQFGSLDFGRSQQLNALDAQRAQIMQDTNYSANQLQAKYLPAQQAALARANSRGLLDSSVAMNLMNLGAAPINNSLSNLYNTQQRQLTAADQSRQGIAQKYNFDLQSLVGKREQEAQAVRDQLATFTAQQQQQAQQTEAQRNAQIYARAGSLGDLNREFGLQQQQVGLYGQSIANTAQQMANQNAQFYYGTKKA